MSQASKACIGFQAAAGQSPSGELQQSKQGLGTNEAHALYLDYLDLAGQSIRYICGRPWFYTKLDGIRCLSIDGSC